MENFYFDQIKFQLNEKKEENDTFQIIIKEQPGTAKMLGKTRLDEASAFAKFGYVPQNLNLNRFICKKSSYVEITFKSKESSQLIKAAIDFSNNQIQFTPSLLSAPLFINNLKVIYKKPSNADIASSILESLYIGNNKQFTFFISGRKKK